MSAREFREWLEYDSIEPFGEQRADLRSAIIAATTARMLGARRVRWSDFMPYAKATRPNAKAAAARPAPAPRTESAHALSARLHAAIATASKAAPIVIRRRPSEAH